MARPRDETEILLVLAGHPVLGRLPEGELRALIRDGTLLAFSDRDEIFTEGEEGSSVVTVLQGFVKLSAITTAGREIVLDLAGPGSVIGEIAVLNQWPRAASAIALSSGAVLAIDGRQFAAALTRTPEAMLAVIHLLSRRLRKATAQARDGVDLPAPVRLAKALLQLAALHSHPVDDGLRIDLQMSQRELGGMTGLIRESINKHLGTWRDAGWIALSDRTVTLRDAAALQALVREHEVEWPAAVSQ